MRIGIAWQGSPKHRKDRYRSMPLLALAPLAAVPGVRLFSLQKGPGSEQVATVSGRFPITDLGSRLETFADTAAVLRNLDLVVTVDTALTHCTGAWACRPGSHCPTCRTGAGCWTGRIVPGIRACGFSVKDRSAIGERSLSALHRG